MRSRSFMTVLLLVAIMALPMSHISAQDNENPKCQSFIRRAFSDLGTNCLKLDSNTACYGHEDVSAMLIEGEAEPEDFFAEPGYRTALTPLARLTGSIFDLDAEVWGLYKTNVRVYTDDIENDDPETLEDNMRDILYVPLGDVEIEDTDMPVFDEEGNLIIDAQETGPMQEIFLRTGPDKPECKMAPPSVLLVQGAEDADTTITVNGAPIKLNAGTTNKPLPTTAILQIMPSRDAMRLFVLFGLVTLNPDSATPLLIPAGHWTILCLDAPQNLGLDGEENDQLVSCGWSDPQQMTRAMINSLIGLQGIPDNILKKPIFMPVIIEASGVGGVVVKLVFNDPDALELARAACEAGELPKRICDKLFG